MYISEIHLLELAIEPYFGVPFFDSVHDGSHLSFNGVEFEGFHHSFFFNRGFSNMIMYTLFKL